MFRSKKPIKIWIDGKCFTVKQHNAERNAKAEQSENNSLVRNEDYNVTSVTNGKVSTSFRLPSLYYIKLNRDFNLHNVELETKTSISVPKNGAEGNLTITGTNEPNVIDARKTIHSIVSEIREKSKPTYFISIPVNTEEVMKSFETFKNEILNGDPIQGMNESIFISPQKLHLTIVVFALMDLSEKGEAIKALDDCKSEYLEPFLSKTGPLKIKVAGIDCMNDNLNKVRILFANARIEHEEEGILQKLVNGISDYCYERGLVIQYKDNVKLHVTLMNTKYKTSSTTASPSRKVSRWHNKKETFNATTIMEKYKDYYFGESVFDSVHLSCMSSVGEDGFYKPLVVVKV